MTLDPELLRILVCPNDRGEVDYHEDEQVIVDEAFSGFLELLAPR